MNRIYITEWEDWVEICEKHGEDPHEICDLDVGYRNSPDVEISFKFVGEYPEKEAWSERISKDYS